MMWNGLRALLAAEVTLWVFRRASPQQLSTVAFATTAGDLAFLVRYRSAFHDVPGAGTLIGGPALSTSSRTTGLTVNAPDDGTGWRSS